MRSLSNTISFVFASDGSLVSERLSLLLQTNSNFVLLSECRNGRAAIAEILARNPDIALIDAHLGDMSAAEIVKAARSAKAVTKLVVLGASAERDCAGELIAAGADAYVVRNGPTRHLNHAIRYILEGGKYISPELTEGLTAPEYFEISTGNKPPVCDVREAVLSQRRTVERLELALERAQAAIERLEQKVEQLSTVSSERREPTIAGTLRINEKVKASAAAAGAGTTVSCAGSPQTDGAEPAVFVQQSAPGHVCVKADGCLPAIPEECLGSIEFTFRA